MSLVCAQLLDNKDDDVPRETADVRLPLEVANAELSSREKKMKELEETITLSKEQYTQVWCFKKVCVDFRECLTSLFLSLSLDLSLSLSLSLFLCLCLSVCLSLSLSLSLSFSWRLNVRHCVA